MGHGVDSPPEADPRSDAHARAIGLAVVVCFLNEAEHLPALLGSLDAQSEPADEVLLVDDGSSDGSGELARAFAAGRSDVRVLTRERRPPSRDRLAQAPELRAFAAGVQALERPWDVVAKLDGDLELSPSLFADVRARMASDVALGITGCYLSEMHDGRLARQTPPAKHVRGATKFYRRECHEQIFPLPEQLGWDTFDELRARATGWRTGSFAASAGDTIHLRPVGSRDGRLRAFRRWGACAWAYGAHPLGVLAGAGRRATQSPRGLGGAWYLWGWCEAAARGYPRLERETRRFAAREDLARIRTGAGRLLHARVRGGARA